MSVKKLRKVIAVLPVLHSKLGLYGTFQYVLRRLFRVRSKKLRKIIVVLSVLHSKLGLYGTFQYVLRRLFRVRFKKKDILRLYDFVIPNPFGEVLGDYDNIINWVIPDFCIGSGGHLNIFRMVHLLEKRGIKCRINIDGPCQFSTGKEASRSICKHFFSIKAEVSIGRSSLRPAAVTVATSWHTAYTVRDFQATWHKLYFVQDIESYFYPRGNEYQLVEDTYYFGFQGITAGTWVADVLQEQYGMQSTPIAFSYDQYLYRQTSRQDTKTRVFFYARPVTARRGFELGLMVLANVHRCFPHVEFVLAGWDVSEYAVPFPYLNSGIVALDKLPGLYSQCDIALVISFTNLSLLPLELMACGCAVVSNRGKNVEWLLNSSNAVLANATVEDLSAAIVDVINDDKKLKHIASAGKEFAYSTSWEREADKVEQVLSGYL